MTATHPDIIRAQIELARMEEVVKSLEEMRRPLIGQLNAELSRPMELELPWPEKEPVSFAALSRIG